MKSTGWKPLVVIQCYEDRHRTPSPRRLSQVNGNHDVPAPPPPQAAKQPAPPPPPMPIEENGEKKTTYIKNGHNKARVNGFNGAALANGATANAASANGASANGASANGATANGKVSNGTLKRTPTPDYEATNVELLAAKMKLRSSQETVEVDSIESYKMRNPTSPQPKPPSTYFARPGATMKRSGRPVSVTIGEYPSRTRAEPARLEFLGAAAEGVEGVEGARAADQPLGSRLQSELALTLSRSNLRRKTEVVNKLDNNGNIALETINSSDESEGGPDKNFQKRYGHNLAPTAPALCIPKVPAGRSHGTLAIRAPSHPVTAAVAAAAAALQNNG